MIPPVSPSRDAPDQNEVIVAAGVRKWYPVRRGPLTLSRRVRFVKAVDDVSFALRARDILGIIGESGCGKSTLGRLLVGLEIPTNGRIYFQGRDAGKLLRENQKLFRRRAQIIFQNPFDTFDPRQTIADILNAPLRIHHIGGSEAERRDICREALEQAGIRPATDYMARYPHELSGGQLQRVSIVRAMLLKPPFLVADEPVSMLDVSVRADILNTLLELSELRSTAIVFISHDISVTRYVSHRIAVMYLGRIVEIGESDEIIRNPCHPYTKALISNSPSTDPAAKSPGIQIRGEPPTPVDPGPGCYFAPRCFAADKECFHTYPVVADLGEGHLVWCHRARR